MWASNDGCLSRFNFMGKTLVHYLQDNLCNLAVKLNPVYFLRGIFIAFIHFDIKTKDFNYTESLLWNVNISFQWSENSDQQQILTSM